MMFDARTMRIASQLLLHGALKPRFRRNGVPRQWRFSR
jgi:hypothetical protein